MTHVPYGYRIVDGIAIIEETEAEKVKILFEEYLRSKSMMAAAKYAGIKKTHSSIGRILKNRVYIGSDFYPSIIDKEIFSKVQALRNKNAIDQNRKKSKNKIENTLVSFEYIIKKIDEKFDNPFKQAEYAYSQIEEVQF